MKKWFNKLEKKLDVGNIMYYLFHTPMMLMLKYKIIYGLLGIVILIYTFENLIIQEQEMNLTNIIASIVCGIVGPFFLAFAIGINLSGLFGMLCLIVFTPFYLFSKIIFVIKDLFRI